MELINILGSLLAKLSLPALLILRLGCNDRFFELAEASVPKPQAE
jgi:hypothetical protein